MSQNKTQEISFFDRFTKDKDYDSLTSWGYTALIKAFRKLAGNRLDSDKCVDLGCGTGSFTRRLLSKGYGIDISLSAIERARSKQDGILYFVSDISALGIKNSCMDVVLFSGVLHHFPDGACALKEAYRVLKPGGLLLSYDPHLHNPAMWLYRHPDSPFCSKVGKTDNEKLLSKAEMQSKLTQAGFKNIQITAISGVGISYLESPIARIFLPLYNAFEYVLGLLPVSSAIGSFLICAAEK